MSIPMQHVQKNSLFFVVSILLVLTLLARFSAEAGKAIPIVPVKGKAVKIIVKGKERTYYSITARNPLHIEVDGPGKLVILSRVVFPSLSSVSERYSVIVREDGKELKIHATQSEKSTATLKSAGGNLGRGRKTNVKIPEGMHKYEVSVESTLGNEVLVRLSFIPAKGKKNLVSLEPLSYARVVTAVVKEKLIAYYVSSKEQPVQLRVVGPTRLKIATRLNYDSKMKGGQRYSVGVWENDKRLVSKALATTKSVGVEYKEWKDVSPGKPVSFYLAVPKGEHHYSFRLEAGTAMSVAVKFSIPKSDLDNEE